MLNVFGLVIGIVGSILIVFFLYDEFSFDRMFLDVECIYWVDVDYRVSGEEFYYVMVFGLMVLVIKDDYLYIE